MGIILFFLPSSSYYLLSFMVQILSGLEQKP